MTLISTMNVRSAIEILTLVLLVCFISSSKAELDWYETASFYQIYPRSFKDSDGDGIGDIQGIISKLGHLKEMGVDGTWLSPIFVSPMKDFGYDISDFYDIQSEYGTMDDAVELFAKAKELNIRIVLDFVPNHSSDQCSWFKLSAANDPVYRDYYVWHEGIEENGVRRPPNNWNSVFYGSAWTWNDQRQAFYLHQFDKSQPDLNFRHQAVVDEMKNVLRFWLDKGASGFRVDAVSHLLEDAELRDEPIDNSNDPLAYDYTRKDYTKDLDETFDMLYQWRDVMDDYQKRHEGETRIFMSEAYGNDTIFKKYYQSADGLRQGSHMPFNFVLVSDVNINSTAADFKRVIDNRLEIVPESKKTNWLMGNHDQPRMASRFGSQMVDALLTLVMTLPGMSVAYNGEEIGMEDFRFGISFDETLDPAALNAYPEGPRDGWQWKSRDPERTPFQWDDTKNAGFCNCTGKPWLPVNDNYPKLNLAHQKASSKSTFRYYKELAQLRKDETMIRGDYKSFVHNDVFGYTRTLSNYEPRLILMNLGKTEQMVRVSKFTSSFDNKLRVMVAGAETPYKKGDIINANRVRLPKYSVIVVENLIKRRSNTIGSLLAAILKYFQTITNKLKH
ncbi:maltase 2-like [Bradysia coprophila]|uniref:maltase 2-like n=1 Tax=Bradysia coprophila TaxID=38358 RepID=UPI00187D978D|nr:maltase 2-like [Bradysia coprophila]